MAFTAILAATLQVSIHESIYSVPGHDLSDRSVSTFISQHLRHSRASSALYRSVRDLPCLYDLVGESLPVASTLGGVAVATDAT